MERRMNEYMMREDGRNPYGSRGGYVSNRRPMRDRDYDEEQYERGYRGIDERYEYPDDMRMSGERDYGYSDRGRRYRGYYGNYPFYMEESEYPYGYERDGRRGERMERSSNRRRRDYGMTELTRREVEEWKEKLLHSIDESERDAFKMDRIIKRASELRVDFEKFSEEEFYVTVLMMYTDYKNTLGKGNVDIYIRLAKDFLYDDDASVKYSEKLAKYYDEIVS